MNDVQITVTNDSPEWQRIYELARNDKSHELWENYQKINLDEYEHMLVNMRDSISVVIQDVRIAINLQFGTILKILK